MDADKLADFGTIKTAHGEVKAAFCIFFLPRFVIIVAIIRISYNVLLYANLSLEYQCIAGQIGLRLILIYPRSAHYVFTKNSK